MTHPMTSNRARFRVWDTLKNRMLQVMTMRDPGVPNVCEALKKPLNGRAQQEFFTADEHSRFILLQWTGTEDLGGNPLYEGDVVQLQAVEGRAGQQAVIIWLEGCWVLQFSVPDKHDQFVEPLYPLLTAIVKKGNRFELDPAIKEKSEVAAKNPPPILSANDS